MVLPRVLSLISSPRDFINDLSRIIATVPTPNANRHDCGRSYTLTIIQQLNRPLAGGEKLPRVKGARVSFFPRLRGRGRGRATTRGEHSHNSLESSGLILIVSHAVSTHRTHSYDRSITARHHHRACAGTQPTVSDVTVYSDS